jgi:hypothetical protein
LDPELSQSLVIQPFERLIPTFKLITIKCVEGVNFRPALGSKFLIQPGSGFVGVLPTVAQMCCKATDRTAKSMYM